MATRTRRKRRTTGTTRKGMARKTARPAYTRVRKAKRKTRRRSNAWYEGGELAVKRGIPLKKGQKKRAKRKGTIGVDHRSAALSGWKTRKTKGKPKVKKNPYRKYGRSTRKGGKRKTARRAFLRKTRRWNPAKAKRAKRAVSRGPVATLKNAFSEMFSPSTMKELLHTGAGFVGASAGTDFLTKETGYFNQGWQKVGATALVTLAETALTQYFTKNAYTAKRVMVGGLVATALRALGEVKKQATTFPGWIPTLGMGDDSFRNEIQAQVLRELRSGNEAYHLPAAGSESYYMPAAGSSAYLTANELRNTEQRAGLAGMGAYLTAREGESLDVFGVASGAVDEIGSGGFARERF